MNIRKYLKISLGAAILAIAPVSCIHDDNWDAPEIVCTNKFDAPTMTMADVVAMSVNGTVLFPSDPKDPAYTPIIFDAYVVSSDENGNFYKTISFQDKPVNPTVGLQIGINKSMNYADFPVGSHIRIKANGLILGKSNGVLQLGSVDPNYTIGRIPQAIIGRYISGVCAGNGLEIVPIVPTVATLTQLQATDGDKYINTLVTVKDVQFHEDEIGLELMEKDIVGTYIDTDRRIVDAANKVSIIRTDGFFRTPYVIPNKSGDITFVVNKYNSSRQNIIRNLADFNFTTDLPPRPLPIFRENFNNFTTNNWTIVNVSGPSTWKIEPQYGTPAPSALMNGYQENSEDWLISKEISLENYTSAFFTFDSWRNFNSTMPLQVYVTTNYTGTPAGTTWIPYSPILATSGNFVNSGQQSLNNFLGQKIRIAFKYTSTTSSAYSYEIDNVIVKAMK